MIIKILKITIIICFIPTILLSNTEYYQEGLNLYKNKKFDDAKFKFELRYSV